MTAEEVIVRMGFDMNAMQKGFAGMDFLVQNSVKKTLGGLKNLVAVNAVSVGMQVLDLWDSASRTVFSEMWNGIYYQGGRITSATVDRLKKAFKDISEVREKFKDANEDFELFAAKDDSARIAILKDRAKENEKLVEEEARLSEAYRKGIKNEELGSDHRAKLVIQAAQHEKKLLEFKTKGLEIEKQIGTLEKSRDKDKERAQEREKQHLKTLEAQRRDLSDSSGKLYDAQRGRREFTVEDLAEADFMRGTPWGRQANQIVNLQRWARENAMLGFTKKSEWQQKRADELFADLQKKNPFLKDPQKDLKDAMQKNWEKLEQIRKEGLAIKPLE